MRFFGHSEIQISREGAAPPPRAGRSEATTKRGLASPLATAPPRTRGSRMQAATRRTRPTGIRDFGAPRSVPNQLGDGPGGTEAGSGVAGMARPGEELARDAIPTLSQWVVPAPAKPRHDVGAPHVGVRKRGRRLIWHLYGHDRDRRLYLW
jgi:hypothetical protein